MVRNNISRIGLAVTAAALAAAVSACGQGPSSAQPSANDMPSQSALASAGSPAAAPTQPATQPVSASSGEDAGGSAAGGAVGLCKSPDLRLSLGGGDGAAGTIFRNLVFTNISGHPCVIQGFPGVSYVGGDDGHQVGPAAYRDGTKGAAITLNSGESSFATVGLVNVENFDPATCQPQPVRGLRVYPPQETASIYVAMATTGCGSDKIPGNQLTVKTIEKGSGS